ncbi:hypothetical protein ACG2LH_12180 [Zhouia sp. PK063]|uniref:hypothetical protein n=1 Tax=Zhouia sp. PK063 TaxID=3373602 RepID=UPI0037BE0074
MIFFTRKSRSNPKLSIYVRITINRKRAKISLKRVISIKDWDRNKSHHSSSQK